MANPFDSAFSKTPVVKTTKTNESLGDIFLKSIQGTPEKPPSRPPVIKKLPAYVGGGEFLSVPGKPEELAKEPRAYGTLPAKPGSERDHIIPVSLGGTSKDPNLQYLTNKKTFWETLFNKPASLKNRQEGKMLVEWGALDDYKKGKISLPEARARVLNWNNQPDSVYDIANKIKIEDWSKTFLNTTGTVLGYLASKVGEGVGALVGTFPQMVASQGKIGLVESAKTSSDFIKNVMSKGIFDEAVKTAPDLEKNVFFQFAREYVKELTGAALMTAASIPLEAVGARIATKKTGIKVTPEQMGDLMTGRPPVGKPLSPQEVEIIKKEFLKPETPKAAVKEAVKTGLEIKTDVPAGPVRELAGAIIGGGPKTPKTEVLVGGKPITPAPKQVPPLLIKGKISKETIAERVAKQEAAGIAPSIVDREIVAKKQPAITPPSVTPPPIAPAKPQAIESDGAKFQTIRQKAEESLIVPSLESEKNGKVVKVKSLGKEGYVPLIEHYKGMDIVKTGDNFSVWDPKKESLFVVALDDSKTNGKRFINQSANNVETARKYIDWVVKPVEKPTTPEAKPAEIKEKPFTDAEQNSWNNYTHYPRDWNKDYLEMVDDFKADIEEKIGKVVPPEVENLTVEFSKRAEQYLRDKGEQMIKAPSPSVVGPANYNVGRAEKARGIYERKAKEFFDFNRSAEQKINTVAREMKKTEFAAMSETEKIKFNIQELKDRAARLNPQRDTFFIEKINKRISSLEKKMQKSQEIKPEVKKETINVPGIGEVPIVGTVDSETGKITFTEEQVKTAVENLEKAPARKSVKAVSKRLDNAIEEIKKEVAEDPDRHPAAIIAGRGFTFNDDIQDLVDYAIAKGDKEFIKIIEDAGWEEFLKQGAAKELAKRIVAEEEITPKEELLKKVSNIYKENLANKNLSSKIDDKIWTEQMQEQIEDPERYHVVKEDKNSEGLKIGDKITDLGGDELIVTSINKNEVHLISPKNYGAWTSINNIKNGFLKKEEVAPTVSAEEKYVTEQAKPTEEVKPQQKFEFTRTGKNAAEKIKTEQTEIQKVLSPDLPATQENLDLVNKLIDNKIEEYRKQAGYTVITEGAGRAEIIIGGEKTTVFSKGKLLKNLGRQKDVLRAQAEQELLEFDDEFKELRNQQAILIDKMIPDAPEEPMFKRTSRTDIERMLGMKILDGDYKFIQEASKNVPPIFSKLRDIKMVKFEDPDTLGAHYRNIIYLSKDIGSYLENKGSFYHEFLHHTYQYLSDADRAMVHSERMKLKETNPKLYKKIFDESNYVEQFIQHGKDIAHRKWMRSLLKNKSLTQREQIDIKNKIISDDFDQEFLSWYGEAYIKKDPKIKFSEKLKNLFDRMVEFLKKLINIHPSTKNFPSEKVNQLIKDIIIGKEGRFKYRPQERPPSFKLGDLMPEEKEVIKLLQEGNEIPAEMQDSLLSLQRKGILQVAGETPASRAKIEKQETAALREQIRQQKTIKKLDNSVSKRLRDVFRIESWSKATTPQLEAVLSEIKGLKKGDSFITGDFIGKNLNVLKEVFDKDPRLVTKREIRTLSEIPPEPTAPDEIRPQDLMAQIKEMKTDKNLDSSVVKRFKEVFGIDKWKTATKEQLTDVLNKMNSMVEGDSFMTDLQIKGLSDFIKEGFSDENPRLITKFQIQTKFKEAEEIMSGALSGKIWEKLFPTVDIKEGHPIITKVVDRADAEFRAIKKRVETGSKENDRLMTVAEKSRKEPVYLTTLDGKTKFKASTNEIIFRTMSGDESIKLTPEEQTEVDWLKKEFERMAEERNLEKRRKYYITHLKQSLGERAESVWRQRRALLEEKIFTSKSLLEAIDYFRKPKQDIPIDILLALDDIIGSKKFFRFALERKGGLAPTMNIRRIYNQYRQIVETANALDKILPEAQAAQQLLLQPKSAIWMKLFLQNLKGRGLDWKFKQGPMGWVAKVGDRIVDANYIKLLAFNWKSALTNLVAGESNSFIWQTVPRYIIGKQRLLMHPIKAYKLISEMGVLDGSYAEVARGESKLLKGAGTIKDVALYGGQQLGELEIRGSFLLGELTKEEWKTGVIGPESYRRILNGLAITQGLYTRIDSPLFVQTTLGRAVLQFGRWRITNAMLLRRIIKGAYEEQMRGERAGINTRRLGKSLAIMALGLYISYELGKAGYKKAQLIALSATELLKSSSIDLLTLQPILNAWRDNPTVRALAELSYTLTELISQTTVGKVFNINVPMPYNKGLSQSYISAIQTARDINLLPGVFKLSDYTDMKNKLINDIKFREYEYMYEIENDEELMKEIEDFNEKQKELITNKFKKTHPDATQKELETEIKRYTIQEADIKSWMKTKKPDESGSAF